MQQSVRREVLAVRNKVGCIDMSTLGKVDVKGADALTFLSRIYCNDFETIKPGRLRYLLMLREDGILYDDGTVAQLGEDHYLVTMTTANAGSVWRWMNKLLQLQWPDLDVQLTSVTDQWASLALAGPESRKLLRDLDPDFEVDREHFPFASVREGFLAKDLPCRVFTVSFSGELCYEINVAAGFAAELYSRVLTRGENYGVTAYGLEALDILRIEKGHLSIGTEIDGRTIPADLGMGRMVSTGKSFIGRALLQRAALQADDRLQLVGLKPADGKTPIPTAAVVTDQPWRKGIVQQPLGHLTAAIDSPTLGYPIALALVKAGSTRIGETLWAVSPVANLSVMVVVHERCFYDPEGTGLHG